MKLVMNTEHLQVFQTEPVHAFGTFAPMHFRHRLYVGFERDVSREPNRRPAVTALFTVGGVATEDPDWHFLEWLEVSRFYDNESAQVIRDEFMGVLKELHPDMDGSDTEAQEDENGVVHFVDTLDALSEEEFSGSL